MLWRKQQFTNGWNVFLREEKVSLTKRVQNGQQQGELKKTLKSSLNFAWKSSAYRQEHSRASEHGREIVRKILTEDLNMRKVCAKMVPKELTEEQKQWSYQTNNYVGTPCLFTGSSSQWLFSVREDKGNIERKAFDDIDDIGSNTMAALKAITQNQFQNCFEGWIRRWHRCVPSQGEYFEGDHGGIQQWGMLQFYRYEFANFIV